MQQIPRFTAKHCQSNGKNQLKRMEWEFMGKSYKFAINPEEFTQAEPNRVTVTQTKGGAWVDDFGGGIQTISIKGTTGFKNSTGDNNKGFSKLKELRDLIRQTYFNQPPGTDIKHELTFHNYTDGESWIVVPRVFSLMRSVARPLLFMYDIQLICIRPANQPKPSEISTSALTSTVSNSVSYGASSGSGSQVSSTSVSNPTTNTTGGVGRGRSSGSITTPVVYSLESM